MCSGRPAKRQRNFIPFNRCNRIEPLQNLPHYRQCTSQPAQPDVPALLISLEMLDKPLNDKLESGLFGGPFLERQPITARGETLMTSAVPTKFWSGCLLAVATIMLVGPPAVADNLDEALIRQAPKLMRYLQDHDYDNVGVLSFRLKKGHARPTFQTGMISRNMSSRLENALALAMNPEQKTIGIVRDASAVAGDQLQGASYRTAQAREKLFSLKYPLAWGSEMVSPDVFLAGKVTLSPNLRTTNVAIEAFDRTSPDKYRRILDFDVKTDRYILADSGYGFSVSKGRRKFSRGPSDDDIIEGIILEEEKEQTSEKTSDSNSASSTASPSGFPVELRVYYGDVEQKRELESGNTWTMDDPKEGQQVTFGVKNLTDETVGVVLTVNGISTLYEETGQATQMTKWVLEPNKTYRIKGYHQKGNEKYVTIAGLPEKLSEEKFEDLGGDDRAGLIHLYVFRPTDEETSAPSFSRSLRRISRPALEQSHPRSALELQAMVAKGANAKGGRGLMAWGLDEKFEKLETKKLGTTSLTDTMVIRYYRPPSKDN